MGQIREFFRSISVHFAHRVIMYWIYLIGKKNGFVPFGPNLTSLWAQIWWNQRDLLPSSPALRRSRKTMCVFVCVDQVQKVFLCGSTPCSTTPVTSATTASPQCPVESPKLGQTLLLGNAMVLEIQTAHNGRKASLQVRGWITGGDIEEFSKYRE